MILFNALQASTTGAGVSRYALELARELVRLRDDVCIAVQRPFAGQIPHSAFHTPHLIWSGLGSPWRRILVEQIALPLKARRFRLVHYPDTAGPVLSSKPVVLSIHDLAFLRYPETFTRSMVLWKTWAARVSAAKAFRLICSSQHTAQDAREFLHVPEEKIRVIYPGPGMPNGECRMPNDSGECGINDEVTGHEPVGRSFSLHSTPFGNRHSAIGIPFILWVGTLEPRKNLLRLLRAMTILKDAGLRYPLVIAGKRGWMYREVLEHPLTRSLLECRMPISECRMITENDEGKENGSGAQPLSVHSSSIGQHSAIGNRHSALLYFLGYCTDAQLRWLYGHAAALAYVSLYEGFGFPPLEAMTAGLPVVASSLGSIPEVCGDAARYVDPTSPEDIAAGIREVCGDAALRDRLITAGRERARLFDWRETARAVSKVYDECA